MTTQEPNDRLSPDREQMQQQINATVEIVLAAPADKDRVEYRRMIELTLKRALSDRPMMFSFEGLKIISLMEEAEIYGNAERPSFNPQQSKEQNIAAITAAVHDHEDAALIYENIAPEVGGFPGVYDLFIQLAGSLTDWEEKQGGLGAYEDNYTDWLDIVGAIAQKLVEYAQGEFDPLIGIKPGLLIEQVLHQDYSAQVAAELRLLFGTDLDAAGFSPASIDLARAVKDDPKELAHRIGEGLEDKMIFGDRSAAAKPPSGKM